MTLDPLDDPNKTKDPSAVLDYFHDWGTHPKGSWLAAGDTITSAVWTITGPDASLVQAPGKPAPFITGTRCTVWLAGGTLGEDYKATCHIVTAQGREDDRTLTIRVRQR